MTASMKLSAPAKINLGLTVTGKRADGYHDLVSVMQTVSLADTVILEPSELGNIQFFCSEPALAGDDNLVWQAAKLLSGTIDRRLAGVKITLIKNIPLAAGLAGGSSDAAAVLRGLNQFWQLELSEQQLSVLALQLGSDVPFCLHGGTYLARGRGEILEPLPKLPLFWVVLGILPEMQISTAAAFNSFDTGRTGQPDITELINAVRRQDRGKIIAWLGKDFTNTLETAAVPGSVCLQQFKKRLTEAGLRPVFSGSGPTYYMLYDHFNEAAQAARVVENSGARAYLCWTVS